MKEGQSSRRAERVEHRWSAQTGSREYRASRPERQPITELHSVSLVLAPLLLFVESGPLRTSAKYKTAYTQLTKVNTVTPLPPRRLDNALFGAGVSLRPRSPASRTEWPSGR